MLRKINATFIHNKNDIKNIKIGLRLATVTVMYRLLRFYGPRCNVLISKVKILRL